MHTPKVLVLTVWDLSGFMDPSKIHGSILCTMNTLECLSQVPGVEYVVVSILRGGDGNANKAFVTSLGMEHVSMLSNYPSSRINASRFRRLADLMLELLDLLMNKYFFMFERTARREKQVDCDVMKIIGEKRPDLIVFDHIYPAFYVPSVFRLGIPCSLISVNNEIPFHRTTRAQGGPVGEGLLRRLERCIYRHGNWLSNWRFERYVTRLYRDCAGIVTLNAADLPTGLPDSVVRAVIPPIFKKSDSQWSYRGRRSIFFVGNIAIYSNRLAVEWICTRFAPELEAIDERIKINIIGASRDQVPANWLRSNVTFMGYADKEEIRHQMSNADLFIAPIENPFGAKLKMAECVSHATPFLATRAAMSGLPFREAMPEIDIARPAAAARLAVEYIHKPQALTDLSRSIDALAQMARMRQTTAWSTFVMRCIRNRSEGGSGISDGVADLAFSGNDGGSIGSST